MFPALSARNGPSAGYWLQQRQQEQRAQQRQPAGHVGKPKGRGPHAAPTGRQAGAGFESLREAGGHRTVDLMDLMAQRRGFESWRILQDAGETSRDRNAVALRGRQGAPWPSCSRQGERPEEPGNLPPRAPSGDASHRGLPPAGVPLPLLLVGTQTKGVGLEGSW